jgi:hypothetical protein
VDGVDGDFGGDSGGDWGECLKGLLCRYQDVFEFDFYSKPVDTSEFSVFFSKSLSFDKSSICDDLSIFV